MIRIAGRLTEEDVKRLAQTIEEESVALGWDGGALDADEAEEEIRACAIKGKDLALYAEEQPWGRFQRLEAVCHELGLTYCRNDSGHYSYGAGVAFWKPGLEELLEWDCANDDSTPLISYGVVQHFIRCGTLEAELAKMEEADTFPFKIEIMPADEPAAA
jgi:hypothetical protein